jgi:hypothetical protein
MVETIGIFSVLPFYVSSIIEEALTFSYEDIIFKDIHMFWICPICANLFISASISFPSFDVAADEADGIDNLERSTYSPWILSGSNPTSLVPFLMIF